MRVKDSAMTERTLPPKKSRTGFETEEKEVNGDNPEKDEEESEDDYVNVFATTVVEGKRRHFEPKGNKELDEWLDTHIEAKAGFKTSYAPLYNCYLEFCMESKITNALEEFAFVRFVKAKYPEGHATKENSTLKDKVKTFKHVNKEKSDKPTGPKMNKVVLQETFADMEYPRDGVMFNALKRHMIPMQPALRLDQKPHILLNALNMGVRNGYVELLRGIGKSGRYRWYDEEADKREADEDEERRKKKREEAKATKDGEEKKEGDEESDKKEGEEGADGDKKEEEEGKRKMRKRKAPPAGNKKKTKKKKKSTRKPSRSFIVHSDPQRIEETFPVAMTFMAEPKKASFMAIEKYIDKNYNIDVKPEKLLKTLDTMAEKGYLEKVSGGGRGNYQLTLDEFDPSDDDDLIGKIVNAIMASVQPKECSVRALKSYVSEFYPSFEVNEKPKLFKRALERAVNKDIIRQISGLGMSGSYQLVETFVPTPVILASKDTPEDYESHDEDDVSSDEGVISDNREVDVSMFADAYKPRATKRRGKAREVQKAGFNPNQAYIDAQLRQEEARRLSKSLNRHRKRSDDKNRKKKQIVRTTTKRRHAESSDEGSEEDEENEESEEEDSTYGSESGEKYRPRKSSSRGGPARQTPSPKKTSAKGGPSTKRQTPAKKSPTKKSATTPVPTKAARKETPKRTQGSAKKAGKTPAKKGARSSKRRR